jgi:hypothetical protein
MVLPVTTFPTAKSVINLSKADLLLALGEGRRATWAKLSAIQVGGAGGAGQQAAAAAPQPRGQLGGGGGGRGLAMHATRPAAVA